MPVKQGLGLPIRHIPISGPAVDLLDSRKEHNDNSPVTAQELRVSFEKVKTGLFSGLSTLLQSKI
jgi:hypothetical protein